MQSSAKQEEVVTDKSLMQQPKYGAEERASLLPAESKDSLFLYVLCPTVLYQSSLIADTYLLCIVNGSIMVLWVTKAIPQRLAAAQLWTKQFGTSTRTKVSIITTAGFIFV